MCIRDSLVVIVVVGAGGGGVVATGIAVGPAGAEADSGPTETGRPARQFAKAWRSKAPPGPELANR